MTGTDGETLSRITHARGVMGGASLANVSTPPREARG